jgi:hypothetical protein
LLTTFESVRRIAFLAGNHKPYSFEQMSIVGVAGSRGSDSNFIIVASNQ